MSLGEYGYKAGGHPQPLTKVRLKLTDAGDVIVIGFDKFDFQREVTNPELLVKFDNEYIHFTNKDMYSYGKGYNYICYFKDMDFDRPWIPSERVPRVTPKSAQWGGIYDLLAEASLFGYKFSNEVPYDELIEKYGADSFNGVSMEGITDIVVKAVQQRNSK